MRAILFPLSLVALSSPSLAEDPWYEGGSLQQATMAEWKVAGAENRLATAADFLAAANLIEDISKIPPDIMPGFRERAVLLEVCVTGRAGEEGSVGTMKVSDAIVTCVLEAE